MVRRFCVPMPMHIHHLTCTYTILDAHTPWCAPHHEQLSQEKKNDKDRKWSRDETDTLHKALLRYPAGTQERWDKIAGACARHEHVRAMSISTRPYARYVREGALLATASRILAMTASPICARASVSLPPHHPPPHHPPPSLSRSSTSLCLSLLCTSARATTTG